MAVRERYFVATKLDQHPGPQRIQALACELGVVRRQRKVDIVALVYRLALGFSASNRRSLAGLRRALGSERRGTTLAPSAFYDRFADQLAQLLDRLAAVARRLKQVLLHEAVDPNLSRVPLPDRAQRGVLHAQRSDS